MSVSEGRKGEISHFLQPYMEECFLESCRMIQLWLDSHAGMVWDELGGIIDSVLQDAVLQKQQEKGDMQYLVFSFMWHSVYENKLELRIEALDDAFYLDEREAARCYRPEFLQDRFRRDLDILYRKAGEGFVRLQNYELDGIRKEYAGFYQSVLFRMIQGLTGLIVGKVKESGINTTERFMVIYGEYMEQAVVLYRTAQT